MNHRSMDPASEPRAPSPSTTGFGGAGGPSPSPGGFGPAGVLPARFSRRQALGNLALTVSAFALAKPLAGAETGTVGSKGTAKPSFLPVFNIRDFGAVPDGKTLSTAAVQRAIDTCGQAGGGTVYVPPGTFLTGTLLLRSNVTLYLEAGATLLGSARIEDYAPQHVLYAKGAQNIGLAGPGTIDGQGHAFCSVSNTTPPRGTRTWVRVAGAKSTDILLLPDALQGVQKPLELGEGVAPEGVSLHPIRRK